jgi:hypothetical protein
MTHILTLDDWDSDGINKRVSCDCEFGQDHHQLDFEADNAYDDCRDCSAILDNFGRCWFCERAWIWSDAP